MSRAQLVLLGEVCLLWVFQKAPLLALQQHRSPLRSWVSPACVGIWVLLGKSVNPGGMSLSPACVGWVEARGACSLWDRAGGGSPCERRGSPASVFHVAAVDGSSSARVPLGSRP